MDWNSNYIGDLVRVALCEDRGARDAEALAIIPAGTAGHARIVAGQDLVVAGLPLAVKVFETIDPGMSVELHAEDGRFVKEGQELLRLYGKAAAMLGGERTALNFLGRLSGIATLTRRFVEQTAGTRAKITGTRESTPGLRLLEKYALEIGGGTNPGTGVVDAMLLTKNHIALTGGVTAALDQAHAYAASRMQPRAMTAYEAVGSAPTGDDTSSLSVEIEVQNESELREALGAGAEWVVLVNMTPAEVRHCVEVARSLRPDCVVEISGGTTLETVRAYAETGADFLSVEALTRSTPAARVSLLVDSIEET